MAQFKATIEENLSEVLDNAVQDVSGDTLWSKLREGTSDFPQTRIKDIPDFPKAHIGERADVEYDFGERNLFQQLGRAAWGGVEAAGNMALLGVPNILAEKVGQEEGWLGAPEAETFIEKAGEAVGSALGFLVPFTKVKTLVMNPIAQKLAGKAGSRATGESIEGTFRSMYKEPGKYKKYNDPKSGKWESKKTKLGKGWLTRNPKFPALPKGVDTFKAFSDNILNAPGGIISKIKGFEHSFATAEGRINFLKLMETNAYKLVDDAAKMGGFKIDPKAVNTINRQISKAFIESGKRPISSVQELVARKFGDKMGASFYSHLFEEALLFATVENLMHGVQVAAGKEEANFGGVTGQALIMGHALGAIRFIPGGMRGGIGNYLKNSPYAKLSPSKRIDMILGNSKNWAKNYDVTKEIDRRALRDQYMHFAHMQDGTFSAKGIQTRQKQWLNDKGLKEDFDVFAIIKDRAKKAVDKNGNRLIKKLKNEDLHPVNVSRIIAGKEGPEASIAMAKIIQDGLGHLGKKAGTTWRNDIKEILKADIIGSSRVAGSAYGSVPRMLVGGLTMMGGPQIMFSEDILFEDKMIAFATGAFLMKGGKQLWSKNGAEWRLSSRMGEFPERLDMLRNLHRALGVEPSNPLWQAVLQKVDFGRDFQSQLLDNVKMDLGQLTPVSEALSSKDKKGNYRFFVKKGSKKAIEEKGKEAKNNIEQRKLYGAAKDTYGFVDKMIPEGHEFIDPQKLTKANAAAFGEIASKVAVLSTGKNMVDSLWKAHIPYINRISNYTEEMVIDGVGLLKNEQGQPLFTVKTVKDKDGIEYKELPRINFRFDRKLMGVDTIRSLERLQEAISFLSSTSQHKIGKIDYPELLNTHKGYKELTALVDSRRELIEGQLNDYGIERHFEYDGWLVDAVRLAQMADKQEVAGNLIYEAVTDYEHPANKLFTQKLTIKNTGQVPSAYTVKGSPELEGFLNNIQPSLRYLMKSPFVDTKQTHPVSRKDAKEIHKLFQEEGIYQLRPSFRFSEYFTERVQERAVDRFVDDADIVVDGKVEPINDTIKAKYREGVKHGIFVRFQAPPEIGVANNIANNDVFLDIMTKSVSKKNALQKIVDYQNATKGQADGLDRGAIAFMKDIVNKADVNKKGNIDVSNDVFSAIKGLNEHVKPMMEQTANDGSTGGFIRADRDVEYKMGELDVLALKLKFDTIEAGAEAIRVEEFWKDANKEIRLTESKEVLDVIGLLKKIQKMSGDTNAYLLASKLKIYDKDKRYFKSDLLNNKTKLQIIKDALIEGSNTDLGLSHRQVESAWARNKAEVEEIELDRINYTLGDLTNDFGYLMSKQFAKINTIKQPHSRQLKDTLAGYISEGKKGPSAAKVSFWTDLVNNIKSNAKDADVEIDTATLTKRIPKLNIDMENSVSVKEIEINLANAKNSTEQDVILKKSPELVSAFKLFGEANVKKMSKNAINLKDGKTVDALQVDDALLEVMYTGDLVRLSKDAQKLLEGFKESDFFSKNLGGGQWVAGLVFNPHQSSQWAVKLDSISRTKIATTFVNKIEEVKTILETPSGAPVVDITSFFKLVDSKGRATKNDAFDRKELEDGTVEYSIKEEIDHIEAANLLHKLRVVHNGLDTVGPEFLSRKLQDASGSQMAEITNRLAQINNISAGNLSRKVLEENLALLDVFSKDMKLTKSQILKHKAVLNSLIRGNAKKGVLADEVVQQQDWRKGGVREAWSFNQEMTRQQENIQQKLNDADASNHKRENQRLNLLDDTLEGPLKNMLLDIGDGDVSILDGITIANPNYYDTMSFMLGHLNPNIISGIKPLYIKADGTQFEVHKTALIKDLDSFFVKFFANNPDVMFLSTTSASKTLDGKYHDNYRSMDIESLSDLINPLTRTEVQQGLSPIRPEELYFMSAKEEKNEASIQGNHTVSFGIGRTDNRALEQMKQDWYQESDNLVELKDAFGKMTDPNRDVERSIMARELLLQKDTEANLDADTGSETVNITSGLISKGAPAHMFAREINNRLLKKYVKDKIFKKKINGGVSVLHPDLGGTRGYLDYSIPDRNMKTWQIGQIELGHNKRTKSLNYGKNGAKINFKRSHDAKHDEIISLETMWNTVKNKSPETKRIWQGYFGVNNDGIGGTIRELGQLHDLIKGEGDFSHIASAERFENLFLDVGKGLEVLITAERAPHVKQDSIILNGLRSFGDKNGTDKAKVNHGDVILALEGDYDIDTVNYWWNSHSDVAKANHNNRWTVPKSKSYGVGEEGAKPSYEGLNLSSRKDMITYAKRIQHSAKMRGYVMNMQRMIQQLQFWGKGSGLERVFKVNPKFGEEGQPEYIEDTSYNGLQFNGAKGRRIVIKHSKEDLRKVYQELANLNQSILDAKKGYDMNIFGDGTLELNGYSKINSRLLYEKGGLMKAMQRSGSADEPGSQGLYPFKGELELLTNQERTLVDIPIRIYREGLSITDRYYEAGESKKVGYDKFMGAIKNVQYNMQGLRHKAGILKHLQKSGDVDIYATTRERIDQMDAKDIQNVYGSDFVNNASPLFASEQKSETMHDYLLRNVFHQGNLNLDISKGAMRGREGESLKYQEEFTVLLEDGVDLFFKMEERIGHQTLNVYTNKIMHLQKYGNDLVSLNATRGVMEQDMYLPAQNDIKNIFSTVEKMSDKLIKAIQEPDKYLKQEDYKKLFSKDERDNIRKFSNAIVQRTVSLEMIKNPNLTKPEIKELVKKELDLFNLEYVEPQQLLQALANQNAWAYLKGEAFHRNPNWKLDDFKEAFEAIDEFKVFWDKQWNDYGNKTQEDVNESYIYQFGVEKIQGIMERIPGENTLDAQQVLLAHLFEVKPKKGTYTPFRGMYMPTPSEKYVSETTMLGLKWAKEHMPDKNYDIIETKIAKVNAVTYGRLTGNVMAQRSAYADDSNKILSPDKWEVQRDSYAEIFETGGGDMSSLEARVNSAAQNIFNVKMSGLQHADKIRLAFVTGAVRDMINTEATLNMPHHLRHLSSLEGRAIGLNGYVATYSDALKKYGQVSIISEGRGPGTSILPGIILQGKGNTFVPSRSFEPIDITKNRAKDGEDNITEAMKKAKEEQEFCQSKGLLGKVK